MSVLDEAYIRGKVEGALRSVPMNEDDYDITSVRKCSSDRFDGIEVMIRPRGSFIPLSDVVEAFRSDSSLIVESYGLYWHGSEEDGTYDAGLFIATPSPSFDGHAVIGEIDAA